MAPISFYQYDHAGPDVCVSSSVVDFGCVMEGTESIRIIHITNISAVTTHYQFDMDHGNHSVFTLEQPLGGSLAANSSLTLRLKFRPHHPIAYHKRLACLILHRVSICATVIKVIKHNYIISVNYLFLRLLLCLLFMIYERKQTI